MNSSTLFILLLVFFSKSLFSQVLPTIKMREGTNLHILSSEPIEFVDLSSEYLVADLPKKQIARVRIFSKEDSLGRNDSNLEPRDLGIITLASVNFLAQFRAVEVLSLYEAVPSSLTLEPEHLKPLEKSPGELSYQELQRRSQELLLRKPSRPLVREKAPGLLGQIHNLFALGQYLFIDLSLENLSAQDFSLEGVEFSLEDRVLRRETNSQTQILTPIYQLQRGESIRKSFRNIYVLPKVHFSAEKTLRVRLREKQLSGRFLDMHLSYRDLLSADSF